MQITELVSELVLQLGIILFAVRIFGQLAKKLKIPSVLGELLAGVLIGPYALGGIALPLFPHGIFPLALTEQHTLAVSLELYAFATVASIVLLFSSGLETNLSLFLRYSIAGSIIGISGALLSFTLGTFCGVFLFNASFFDFRCLFLGVIACTTSVGISARTLSERKKMDSPEGVTMLTAAVFDDVLWIILLAVVLGIVSVMSGNSAGSLSPQAILLLAGKVFGIWLGVTSLFLVCSKPLAAFLKIFKNSVDFSILALGLSLILAGLLEKQGLALIIGAYIAGLSLSKTDIAAVIQERIRPLYTFFVPIFFAVMGMMVNVREILSPPVLIFGVTYTLVAIFGKIIGAGGSALLLGFNRIGAIRIGTGMIPRGEGALITCGIGLAAGALDNQLFSAIVFMIFLTIVASPPLLGITLKIPRQGTRKPVKNDDSVHEAWEFESGDIADLVMSNLLKELRSEGFFVQSMNVDEGLSQVRKDDIAIFITKENRSISIATSRNDMPLVRNEIYEVIINLSHVIEKLKESVNPEEMKEELLDYKARTTKDILALLDPECFAIELLGATKEEIITELVDILAVADILLDRDMVLADVLEREQTMSTGMNNGIALPHAKTDGIAYTAVAVGIKKEGAYFESMDGKPSRLFILVVSPKKSIGSMHVQFLAAVGAILRDEAVLEAVINSATPHDAVELMRKHRK
ncbi:MAG: cation:proton antiporter [Treponema sp.]|jgi:Kef-type K+ transport system membrane component KefB/mannitol/fructose-specific phosphotransferase system IIA component (Ntr-type)|nr:cation:proton antiporter [Treponema sp.]